MRRGFFLLLVYVSITATAFAQSVVLEVVKDIPVESVDGSTITNSWDGGLNSPQFNTLDLNGDGREDLIIFERTSDRIRTFVQDSGKYRAAPDYESFFPDDLTGWVLLRDYNCDGRKDLFTHARFGIRVFESIASNPPQWELVQDPVFTEGSSGEINLQVNITDIPGIDDLDGDGDLDILVYNFSIGGGIEYHKNLSVENGGSCGLTYRRETRRWGDFEECVCDEFAFGEEECPSAAKLKHVGGKTILTFDSDGDGDKDVLIGQEDCEPLYYLENEGTSQDARMTTFSKEFPDTAQKIEYFIFPASYYEDVNGDNIPDLISSPNFSENEENGIDFRNSVWLYENTGTESSPAFQRASRSFLQQEMIDVGENASVSFADYDNDGDRDLFVAQRGELQDNVFAGAVWQFENTGSVTNPRFRLVTDDFLGLRARGESDLKIQFIDLNQDNQPDLAISGTSNADTELNVFLNQGDFSFSIDQPQNISVQISVDDNFHFAEINGDRNIDLLAGRSNGRLDFYRSAGVLRFSDPQEGFYGIEEDFTRKRLTISVSDINRDGISDLITGDERGRLTIYTNFIESINNPVPGVSPLYKSSLGDDDIKRFGNQFFLSPADIFGSSTAGIAIGTRSGGIQILRYSGDGSSGNDTELNLVIYPNPTDKGRLIIESNQAMQAAIYNTMGQPVQNDIAVPANQSLIIDTSTLPAGLYILKGASEGQEISRSFVVY